MLQLLTHERDVGHILVGLRGLCLPVLIWRGAYAQERAVQTYRLFGINASGNVVSEDQVQCVNDAEARDAARLRVRDGIDVEIWDVSRRVPKQGERGHAQRSQRPI